MKLTGHGYLRPATPLSQFRFARNERETSARRRRKKKKRKRARESGERAGESERESERDRKRERESERERKRERKSERGSGCVLEAELEVLSCELKGVFGVGVGGREEGRVAPQPLRRHHPVAPRCFQTRHHILEHPTSHIALWVSLGELVWMGLRCPGKG
eukprot:3868748-Rhodomonas_salina.1